MNAPRPEDDSSSMDSPEHTACEARVALRVPELGTRREVVNVTRLSEDGCFVIENIPAFAYGIAYRDTIRVIDEASGEYELIRRSGQITVRVFVEGPLAERFAAFVGAVTGLGGFHEVGANASDASLLLVSLDAKLGFPRIEQLMKKVEGSGATWEYGNVYDDEGRPHAWWT